MYCFLFMHVMSFLTLQTLSFASSLVQPLGISVDASKDSDTRNANAVAMRDSESYSLIMSDVYLQGDVNILSQNAPRIVHELSSIVYEKTGIKTLLHVVKDTPKYTDTDGNKDINAKFENRRFYESGVIQGIQGKYAIIFLFYNDHVITLKSNLDFLNSSRVSTLLEHYAYPYLPADAVGTPHYNDGVNEGVSNLYLALIHTIAKQYGFELNAPKPMEQQSTTVKAIMYLMLLILIGLYILLRLGVFTFKKKG